MCLPRSRCLAYTANPYVRALLSLRRLRALCGFSLHSPLTDTELHRVRVPLPPCRCGSLSLAVDVVGTTMSEQSSRARERLLFTKVAKFSRARQPSHTEALGIQLYALPRRRRRFRMIPRSRGCAARWLTSSRIPGWLRSFVRFKKTNKHALISNWNH
eukprot:3421306-Prymnesium_polylepis.2